jgi:hypothetical protein
MIASQRTLKHGLGIGEMAFAIALAYRATRAVEDVIAAARAQAAA